MMPQLSWFVLGQPSYLCCKVGFYCLSLCYYFFCKPMGSWCYILSGSFIFCPSRSINLYTKYAYATNYISEAVGYSLLCCHGDISYTYCSFLMYPLLCCFGVNINRQSLNRLRKVLQYQPGLRNHLLLHCQNKDAGPPLVYL